MATTQFMKLSSRVKDLTGKTFGRLTVIGPVRSEHGTIVWICQCSCGSFYKEFYGSNLKQGNVQSCGCLAKELKTKHGLYHIPEYQIWKSMRARCNNPNEAGYHRYGGRGITICNRWNDFRNFISDMGRRPNPTDTLERIDNNMGYLGANCCWASRKVQNNNTRRNHYITHNGETHTMSEWSEITGISYTVIRKRLNCLNWSVKDALSKPVDFRFRSNRGEK